MWVASLSSRNGWPFDHGKFRHSSTGHRTRSRVSKTSLFCSCGQDVQWRMCTIAMEDHVFPPKSWAIKYDKDGACFRIAVWTTWLRRPGGLMTQPQPPKSPTNEQSAETGSKKKSSSRNGPNTGIKCSARIRRKRNVQKWKGVEGDHESEFHCPSRASNNWRRYQASCHQQRQKDRQIDGQTGR